MVQAIQTILPMMIDQLLFARDEQQRLIGNDYDIMTDPDFFGLVWRDTAEAISSWPRKISPLIRRHLFKSNRSATTNTAPPLKCAFLSIDIYDELIVYWYPYCLSSQRPGNNDLYLKKKESDYLKANSPNNQILNIKAFRGLYDIQFQRHYTLAEAYLLEAIKHLIDQIYEFLNFFIAFEYNQEFALEYQDQQLISCSILDATEKNMVDRLKKLEAELEERIIESGISPIELLVIYNAARNDLEITAEHFFVPVQTIKDLLVLIHKVRPEIFNKMIDNFDHLDFLMSDNPKLITVDFDKKRRI